MPGIDIEWSCSIRAFRRPRTRTFRSGATWTYKFVWMLQAQALYFCRADRLRDPYEGYYTAPMASAEAFVRFVRGHDETIDEESAGNLYRQLLKQVRRQTILYYVSCWRMNEDESPAMWKLYTPHGESIAVRSTYEALCAALPQQHCYVGCVQYIDYGADYIPIENMFNYIMHKRRSFAHERELRALTRTSPGQQPPFQVADEGGGVIVPIRLGNVFDAVFVSPDSKPPFLEVVQGLTKVYGLDVPVRPSGVDAPPAY
jgi:hypothetical protein